jgi:hypothetical protein
MILVHASPKTLAPYRTENLGVLCSPRCVYADDIQEWPWAADDDAFSKWDEGRSCDMLDRIKGRTGCLFVTAPDVVGDARKTLDLFYEWVTPLQVIGQPIALVAQDGLKNHDVPWALIDSLFIGGTTEWKLGMDARLLMLDAKNRGKWVHMGRVNSYERGRYARWLGCDSIDGTQFSWFRDTKLPAYLNALKQETLGV